jgi:hypothetical protein
MRRSTLLVALCLALALAAPAAFAQVQGPAGSGDTAEAQYAPEEATGTSDDGSLPFTGIIVAGVVLTGVLLLGTGLALRRRVTGPGRDQLEP